jgi:hypothetical protein
VCKALHCNAQFPPFSVAVWSKAWVSGRSLARIAGSNLAAAMISPLCFRIEVSETGRSLVQRSPTEFGVSECDRESSIPLGTDEPCLGRGLEFSNVDKKQLSGMVVEFDLTPCIFTDIPIHGTLTKEASGSYETFIPTYLPNCNLNI